MNNRQSGFISFSWAAIFFSGAVIIMFAVKLGPVYSEDIYVSDSLKFLVKNNADVNALDKGQIIAKLQKYMTINSVRGLQGKSFTVKKMRDKMIISSEYEVRVPMILNIDAVLTFKSQLDTSKTDECCKYLIDVSK